MSITKVSDDSWSVTVDVNLRTTNELFFDEEGKLLGFLPACEDPISLDRVLRLCANDIKEEIIEAIKDKKRV